MNKFFFFLLISVSAYVFADIQKYSIENGEEQIEFFMFKPGKEGSFPVIFLLHGYQPQESSTGGKKLVDYEYFEPFVMEGIVPVAISMPGYGKSTGKRDFGGPDSQKAVIAVMNHVKELPFVDASRMGIYGISRGAQLAGMVTSCYPDLSFQILESGFYDLVSFQADAPDYLDGIKNSIVIEGGNNIESLIERSVIYHIEDVKAATLILQGELDDRRQLPSSKEFHEQLLKKEINSHLRVFQKEMHVLSKEKWDVIIPFVRERFFDLYGIGIKVSEATPAMQILKIHPNSPAEKSQKLKVGDAILSLSPMNDTTEIPTLRMPVSKFVSLVLGKKDSVLRIRVQHFDLSIEDIIIERW